MPPKAKKQTQKTGSVATVDVEDVKAPSTPKSKVRASRIARAAKAPVASESPPPSPTNEPQSPVPTKRVESFSTPTRSKKSIPLLDVTPKAKKPATPHSTENDSAMSNVITSSADLIPKGSFGMKGRKPSIALDPKVQKIYKLVNKSTGSLGGNGYDGAIYGELTMHSMQKVLFLT